MENTEPVELDPSSLARLRDWGGEDLLDKMVELFLVHAPERLEQIREGIARSKPELVERGAHSLKSTAANLGAEELSALAAELEDRALEGESGGLKDRLPELESAYERARTAIAALREGGAPAP